MSSLESVRQDHEAEAAVNGGPSQPYHPALDGLRALAILSVLVFHLNPKWLPGGFAGVDVFFVLSGFLISNVILYEQAHGSFSFARFYQRRIARLFPSIFVVLPLTFCFVLAFFDARDVADQARHMAQAALSVANIFNAHEQNGYFGVVHDTHVYLHFWSLSVEEQFYVFFPSLLLISLRFSRKKTPLVLFGAFLVSFAICVVKTRTDQAWAFYMLPARAWEMLAGGLLATIQFTQAKNERVPAWSRPVSWAGLLVILVSFVLMRDANFPGYRALLPVVGSVAVIAGSETREFGIGRLLAYRPLVAIGRLSYVLYLWHLPVFSLVDYRLYMQSEVVRVIVKLTITVVLTLLTSRFIENPGRRFFNAGKNRMAAYGFALLMFVTIVPVGMYYRQRDLINPRGGILPAEGIAFNQAATGGRLVVMGDSHATALSVMLPSMAQSLNMPLNVICLSGSDPFPQSQFYPADWPEALARVQHLRPEVLIVDAEWEGKLKRHPERLGQALKQLKLYAQHIVLLTEPASLPADGSREGIRNGAHLPFFESEEFRASRERANGYVMDSMGPQVTVVDIRPQFAEPDGSTPFTDKDGVQLFFDQHHLSKRGVERVVPALYAAIKPFSGVSKPENR